MCHVTRVDQSFYVWHESFICVDQSCHAYEWLATRLIHRSLSPITYDVICMTWLWLNWSTHMNDMTYEWVMSHNLTTGVAICRAYTFMNESCHTYEWVMSHMSNICMSHVTHMNDSCHTWMSHGAQMNSTCHTYEWVVSHVWMSRVTHMNESCHTCGWVTSHVWLSRVTRVHESFHTC